MFNVVLPILVPLLLLLFGFLFSARSLGAQSSTIQPYEIIVNGFGKQLDNEHNRLIFENTAGYVGFADTNGRIIVTPEYDDISVFDEGIAVAGFIPDSEEEAAMGLIDVDGNIILDPEYPDLRPIGHGMYAYEELAPEGQIRLWGCLNRRGEVVTPAQFTSIGSFSDELASVSFPAVAGKDPTVGFLDTKGELSGPVLPGLRAETIGNFRIVEVSSDTWYGNRSKLVDKMGKEVLPPVFASIGELSEGLIAVTAAGVWVDGVVAGSGAEGVFEAGDHLTEIDGQWLYSFDHLGELLSEYRKGQTVKVGRYRKGHLTIHPIRLGRRKRLGVVIDRLKTKNPGYIDLTGTFVINPGFVYARAFNAYGRPIVAVPSQEWAGDVKWGIINKQGDWLIPPYFHEERDLYDIEGLEPEAFSAVQEIDFNEEYKVVEKELTPSDLAFELVGANNYRVTDLDGNPISDYSDIIARWYEPPIFPAIISGESGYRFLHLDGRVLTDALFDDVRDDFYNGIWYNVKFQDKKWRVIRVLDNQPRGAGRNGPNATLKLPTRDSMGLRLAPDGSIIRSLPDGKEVVIDDRYLEDPPPGREVANQVQPVAPPATLFPSVDKVSARQRTWISRMGKYANYLVEELTETIVSSVDGEPESTRELLARLDESKTQTVYERISVRITIIKKITIGNAY